MLSIFIFYQVFRQSRHKRHGRRTEESTSSSQEQRCTLRRGRRVSASQFEAAGREWHEKRPGHFVVDKRLGGGSFGHVFRAVDEHGRRVALKALDRYGHQSDPHLRALLRREVLHHSQLTHPNIARLHGVIEDGKYIILVQELVNGGDLFRYMKRQTKRLSEHEVKRLVYDVLRALNYCHEKGIVHADIKPENILISISREGSALKLADFGSSLHLADKSHANEWRGGGAFVGHTGEDEELGTAQFSAPEIWDKKPCNLKVDIWALGVMTYEMICGFLPFGLSNEVRRPEVADLWFPRCVAISDSGKDFIAQLLSESVDDRLSSCDALQHEWFCPLNSFAVQSGSDWGGRRK